MILYRGLKTLKKNLLLNLLIMFIFACSSNKVPSSSIDNSSLANELYSLKARVDDLNNKIYILNEQVDTLRAKTVISISNEKAEDKKEKAASNEEITTSKIRQEYNEAYKSFTENRFAKSLLLFTSFIEKYPNSALTDNAYFWIGEAYFKQAEYKLALDEYLKLVNKFPTGSKAAEAMLKIAVTYELLKNPEEAIKYYKELIIKYPNSKSSITAKTNLDKIKGD